MCLSMFTEENLEDSHKILRNDELNHSRQFSREERAADVIQRKLDASDPIILMPEMAKHRPANHIYSPELLAMAETSAEALAIDEEMIFED